MGSHLKRLSSLCLLFVLAFSGCLHITGTIGDERVDLVIAPQGYSLATATPRETPAPSITPTATVTRTPSPTATSTAVVFASPTPDQPGTPMPTIAATSEPKPSETPANGACIGRPSVDNLRVRSTPSTADLSNVVGSVGTADILTIEGQTLDGQWLKIWDGYVWASLVNVTGTGCASLPTVNASRLGLHLIFSARWEDVARILPRLGTLKGTDGTEAILRRAHEARPDLLIVYRSIFTSIGKHDCPPSWGQGNARVVAEQWFDVQYQTIKQRGLLDIVDHVEMNNECLFVGAWENTYYLRLLELANSAGICLCVYSDAYGNPEIAQFVQRTPVLDAMLAQPCRNGRTHAIGYHVYEGTAGGDWKFGRYRMFMAAVGRQYERLPILVTEYSLSNGRGAVDCAALWSDWQQADQQFSAQVLGVHLYSVGGGSEWSDISQCLQTGV